MHNAGQNIEHLEGTLANAQDVLDSLHRAVTVAESARTKADEIAQDMRRTVFVLAVAGVVIVALATTRRLGGR